MSDGGSEGSEAEGHSGGESPDSGEHSGSGDYEIHSYTNERPQGHHDSGAEEGLEAKAGGNHNRGKEPSREGKGSEKISTRTVDGAVAIIAYEDPETGKVEFYLEQKPQDYAIAKYRGKLSFVGGGMETTDPNSLEALVREISEEVESDEAKAILIGILRSKLPSPYTVLKELVNGKQSSTYIYVIKVASRSQWLRIKNSQLTHDAGPKQILTLEEVLGMGDDDFAFDMRPIILGYIREHYVQQYRRYSFNASHGRPGASTHHSAPQQAPEPRPFAGYSHSNPYHGSPEHMAAMNPAHYSRLNPLTRLEDRIRKRGYFEGSGLNYHNPLQNKVYK